MSFLIKNSEYLKVILLTGYIREFFGQIQQCCIHPETLPVESGRFDENCQF